jgi:hypothetical protein
MNWPIQLGPIQICKYSLDSFEGVVRTLAKEVHLKYGIGYQRDFNLGPEMYAYGLVVGLKYSPQEMAEGDRNAAWMHERPGAIRHLQGYFRDVYPLNILSSQLLSREVRNLHLARWIQQTSDRGHLAQLSDEAWLWRIAESHLAVVKADLQQAGCTIVPPTLFTT